MLHNGAHCQFLLLKQLDVVLPQIVGSDSFQLLSDVLLEIVDDPKVGANGAFGVIAAHEFLAHPFG